MLLGKFAAEIVQNGETFEEALDREARLLVVESRAESLLPLLHQLLSLDLSDQPFAQLLIALLANHEVPKNTTLAFERLEAATAVLVARGDRDGQAIASWVRGNILLGVGDVAGAARAWRRAADLDPETDLVEDMSLANLAYASYGMNGNVTESLALATSAAASARKRNDERAEGLALIYCAELEILAGRFEDAERALIRADEAFGEASGGEPVYEWPLAHAGIGALAALRGRREEADTAFLRGVLLARELGNPWYEAITRTFRADHTLAWDSLRAHADCRWALNTFRSVSDSWWGTIVLRVRADAALAAGEVEASRQLALSALAEMHNPVERGRCLTTLGRAMLAGGDQEAAAQRADEAVRALETTGADFLLCDALLLSAECDPPRAPDAIERARRLTTSDPAFAQLWSGRPSLRIEVLGRCSVSVGTTPVRFRTSKAEALVLMLALAGGRGIETGQIASCLWPDGASGKAASNLSTATYDARQALGSESWRLHRSGSQLWLDLDGAFVDLDDAMQRAHSRIPGEWREALLDLSQEVLPTLRFEEWVTKVNQRRETFLTLAQGNPPEERPLRG
jgi:DNA-binding SARP family transcriptional activator